ncbi:MAG: hypothetical protein II712_02015 [Erysipelotrichaceae bacterium]|nr:hypothetical protein [Erysipelotrichaceae bacterium]
MKKLLLIMISLLMALSLFGCDKTKKFDDSELLQSLEDNSRFVCKEDKLYASFSKEERTYTEFIKNSGYYRTMEIAEVKKLEENRYEIRMHVPAFEGNDEYDPYEAYDLFYTITYDLSKPTVCDCVIENQDRSSKEEHHFVSDKGLSAEELLKLLEENSWYLEQDKMRQCRFVAGKKVYQETVLNSGYFLEAQIAKVEYLGADIYELTLHVPAFEGNEMTDAHDAYDLIYKMDIDTDVPTEFDCTVEPTDHSYSNSYYYVSDKGLTLEDLLAALDKNGKFYSKELELWAWFTAADGMYHETKDATSYYLEAKITGFEYRFDNNYELTVHVDGFAGNEMMDAYDPYDFTIDLHYDPAKPAEYDAVLLHTSYAQVGHFVHKD